MSPISDTDMQFLSEAKDGKKPRILPPQNRKYACTVVSMLPFVLNEDKPHMLPSSFHVPASENGKLGILHVEEGIHYIPNPLIEEGKPNANIRQTTLPDEMARSIVQDYSTAQVSLGPGAEPGLFWVPGRLTEKEVVYNYPELIEEYSAKQKKWFHNLVALADADWNKNHNMLAVSDLQRSAARALGIKKEWVEFQQQETVSCPFCTVSVPPFAIVCPNCKNVIDKVRYEQIAGVAK